MNSQAPKSPQEALNKAIMVITNLRDSLPGKVGKILTCVDEIEQAWENQDLDQFPFNLLYGEIKALANMVASEYDDPDHEIDRRSSAYEQVLNLQHRLRMSIEFIVSSKVYESVERLFHRIDTVLPTKNYAMRDLLSELNTAQISASVRTRLEQAVTKFDHQEYQTVLQECGRAGEALFTLYKEYIVNCGCDGIPSKVGPALEKIRSWLQNSESKDPQGLSLAIRSRIEWLLLYAFEMLHYLRNAASHALEVENNLPKWQSQHRELFTVKPYYARLGLCLTFQIALELQALLEHQDVAI